MTTSFWTRTAATAAASLALALGSMSANATPTLGTDAGAPDITGDWDCEYMRDSDGVKADCGMTIESMSGDWFKGYLDWLCLQGSSLECKGREWINGWLNGSSGLLFMSSGVAQDAENIGPSIYWGDIIGSNEMHGSEFFGGKWTATRVSHSVPEPGTLALLGLGLAGLGFTGRRKFR